jgi:hypothetical protein
MRTRIVIRILTLLIVLLPLSEIFLVSYSTFIDLSNKWRTIEIYGGNHSYYPSVKFIYNLDEIEFYFKPNESWFYSEPERNGWSKIRGFSKGLHHDNASARLVYKCIRDSILIVGGYCYVNGIHPNENGDQQSILDTISTNRIYHCLIKYEDRKFKFQFENKYWECFAGDNPSWGYMLNPFIGGVFTLDHDWYIDIVDINRHNAGKLQAFGLKR